MPLFVTATCGVCGHPHTVDLDRHTRIRWAYKDGAADASAAVRVKLEEYSIPCPRCGEYTVEEFEIEEPAGGAS